jgi:transposase-like protein
MTNVMMTLRALIEKAPDADLLREMIGFAAHRLMELEVQGLTGAGWGEKTGERLVPTQRLPRPWLGNAGRNGGVKACRQDGRVVSAAVIIAVGVNADGRREVLGMDIGPSEAETFWTSFLRKLTRRGRRGVKLVISDAYEGLKAAVAKVLNATWQRCRVHFMRNALAHAGKSGPWFPFISTAFAQNDADAARTQWRKVADQLRPTTRRLAEFMDEAETDVLAYMTFPKEHWTKIHSVNPLERLNGEVKRRINVVGIFTNEDAITRLVGAILLEQNDEWAVQRARYLTLGSSLP